MQIRAAGYDEAAELTVLARASKASWGYPVEWLQEWAEELTITREYLATAEVLVATLGSGIAGMIAVHDGDEGPEIEHLWVSPEAQGRGIGLTLVRRAMQYAEEKGWTELRIVSDPNAERFYERLGATQVGDVAAPVMGVDRWLPVLSLPVVTDGGPVDAL